VAFAKKVSWKGFVPNVLINVKTIRDKTVYEIWVLSVKNGMSESQYTYDPTF